MSFRLARLKSGHVPKIVTLAYASGSDFTKGALLLKNGSNEFAECGADPAAIAAVAQAGVGADTSGYGGHGFKEFPPGYVQGIAVQDEVSFFAQYTGTLPAVDGGSYGVVDVSGTWKVDFSETVATRVKLVGRRTAAPENLNEVEVVFLAANAQII